MTGFAREAGASGPHQWAWELKSVNGRGLEVRVRTPPGFDAAGEAARRLIAAAFARGQCQLTLTLTLTRAPGPARVRINREILAGLVEAIGALADRTGIAPASLDGLLAIRGVVEVDEDDGGAFDAVLSADLLAGAGRLVVSLAAARAGEGAALAGVIGRQLDGIERLLAAADAAPSRSPDAVRARLAAQVAALLEASQVLDPARLHQEAALLATRADIREELDRLAAHLAAARALLAAGGPVGRKLDFLAQELGRETNTLCAKAGDVALSGIGLDLKALVEQVREQVQNVE